jgi:hypothetical protein
MPGPRDVKVLKYSKRGGQRPEVKTLRVLGNQRLTSGGQIKRAKPPKQKSAKNCSWSSFERRDVPWIERQVCPGRSCGPCAQLWA